MNHNTFFKNKESVNPGPFSYITPSVFTSSVFLGVLLVPQIVMLFVTQSFSALAVVLQAVLASVAAEAGYMYIKKKNSGMFLTAVIQGVLTGLLIPENYPPLALFLICISAFILSKYVFGSFSYSWINPVAFTIAFLYFLCPEVFPALTLDSTFLRSRNAALGLIQSGEVNIIPADSSITEFLNTYIFSSFGISIPNGYVSLFWDSSSVIPAFRFNVLTLFSSLVLLSFDIIEALIPGVFITVYVVLIKVFSPVGFGGAVFSGDALLCLLTGGTLFCSTFLLQWYGTTPLTKAGKIIYGVLGGLFAFFVMGFGTSPAGAVFTVLLMNFISPLIQFIEERNSLRSIKRNLIPRIETVKNITGSVKNV